MNENFKFGKNYSQFENRPKEAIEFLLKKKQGQTKNVCERKDLGKIDFVWGNDNFGIQHIRKRHFIEQDDFSSYEDMAEKISDVLENGKVGKFYNNGKKVDIKFKGINLVLVKVVVFDEEDNFKDKRFILTSFDESKSIEDKIRKGIDYTYPGNSAQGQTSAGVDGGEDRNSSFSVPSPFSESKDKTFQSTLQQIEEINLLKAKKGSPLGTEKEWGGKIYIKTTNGWRPKSKKSSKQEDDSGNKSQKSEEEDSKKGSSFFY